MNFISYPLWATSHISAFLFVNRSTAAAHHNLASDRYTEPRPFVMYTTREISKQGFEYEFKMNMDDPTAPDKASFSTVDRFYAPSHLRIVTKAGDDEAGHIIELYISPAAPGFCNMCTRQILVKNKDGKVQYTGRQTRDSQIKVCSIPLNIILINKISHVKNIFRAWF